MYNSTTRNYTMEDASGSYGWLVETLNPTDFQGMTDEEIYVWVDREVATAKENAGYELDEQLENLSFPRMGYTTDQVFEDADEYAAFKRAEIESDLDAEREYVFKYIKNWIQESVDALALQQIMTAAEVAEEFGLSESTVRQAINRGQIAARKSAGTWLVLRKDAEKQWG